MSKDNQNYKSWIEDNVPNNPLGKCEEITLSMSISFPELKRVKGIYHDAFWGKRCHWWLVDSNRNIVDPTKAQFPDQGGEYEEIPEDELEYRAPFGKCMYCAEPLYSKTCYTIDFCSAACYSGFAFSLF